MLLFPFIVFLLIHLLMGVLLAIGVFQYQNRSFAVIKLLRKILLIFTPSFFLPLLLEDGYHIDIFALAFIHFTIGIGIICHGYVYGSIDNDFEQGQAKIHRAAAFISGGMFPLACIALSVLR